MKKKDQAWGGRGQEREKSLLRRKNKRVERQDLKQQRQDYHENQKKKEKRKVSSLRNKGGANPESNSGKTLKESEVGGQKEKRINVSTPREITAANQRSPGT